MSNLLRKISRSKWEPNMHLMPASFTADAITGCTRTTGNTLSVWVGNDKNFSSPDVEKLVVALASSMHQPATIDLVWLDANVLSEKGIAIIESDGESKIASYNSFHRDLANLTHEKLSLVGEHIVAQLRVAENYKRFKKNDLIKLVAKWVVADFPDVVYELSADWQAALEKEIGKGK